MAAVIFVSAEARDAAIRVPLQRHEQLPAESQRHQLGGRQAEGRHVTKAVQQAPADLAIDPLSQ
jgi:hypothetical protein